LSRRPLSSLYFVLQHRDLHSFPTRRSSDLNYEELYADEEIDIIYLATPNSYHAENMKDILNAGKHVLCEKAITMNKKELDEVLRSEEHTSELQSRFDLVCRLLLEKKNRHRE